MPNPTVFFISDGTGITAETFGNAILAQFELKFRHVRLPFIDSVDKAHQAVRQINHAAEVEGRKPIVFTTLVDEEVLKVIVEGSKGMMLDMFGTFVNPLEAEFGIKSNHRIGRFSDASKSKEYLCAILRTLAIWPSKGCLSTRDVTTPPNQLLCQANAP